MAAAGGYHRVRFVGKAIASSADMRLTQARQYCALDEPCQNLIKTAVPQFHLTAWTYHQALKLSRTIADLVGSEVITQVHLAKALQYRSKLDLK